MDESGSNNTHLLLAILFLFMPYAIAMTKLTTGISQ